MAINKRKVLEAARKYAQKGAQAKALKEFGKLLKLDPRDARLRLEVGDAHRRWGNEKEAIETYKKVAEQYMKEGFDARAVAVYKQIHNLAPAAYDSYEPLADLYQRMGLVSEAILALQTAADGYHKEGKKKEALDLLRKMATLDPSNTTSRIKVADLLRQEGLLAEAVKEYVEASAELERQGDRDGAVSVYERILEVEPDRIETLELLAGNLVERGLGERAEPFAKRILEAKPDEPAHYELMATVYRLEKRDDELVETYRNLADLHRRRGDDDQAREILQRYVPTAGLEDEIGIDDETAFAGMNGAADLGESGTFGDSFTTSADEPLGSLSDTTGFGGLGLDGNAPTLLDDEMLAASASGDDGSFLTLDDSRIGEVALELDDALVPESDLDTEADGAAAAEPAPEPAAAPTATTGDPEQLLAEASVYLRYGKREQAIANLEAIIEQDAEHRMALEKLGEACAESGDGPRAVSLWLRSAEIARSAGDVEAVAVLRDRIAALDEAAAARLEEATARREEATAQREEAAAQGEATVIDLDSIDSGAAAESQEIDLDDIEIDLDDPDFAEDIPSVEDGAADEAAIPETPASGAPGVDRESDALGSSSAVEQQLGEDLEEADFYMKQGLADEAEVIYKRVLSIAPNHPHALVRLGEVAASRGDDPSATSTGIATSKEARGGDGLVDDAGESLEPEWNDEIAGPDDVDLAPPTLEYSVAEGASTDSPPEPVGGDEESSLEDDLANQFLADVAESEDPVAADEKVEAEAGLSADSDDVVESVAAAAKSPIAADAGLTPAAAPAASDDAEAGDESIAADDGDTLEESGDGVAEDEEREINSPDDSFADSSIDLGEAPELVVPAAAAPSDAPQFANDDSFDLAAELSDVFDDESNGSTMTGLGDSGDGFEAVFNEFKKGVSRTLSEDDHEAHFDLGIAYREMGLLDDAKSEFQAAMLNVDREVECRHMLGMCCFEQNQYEEAISQFEQIAASPVATDEQQLSAQFELGRGWEALGESERARTAWEAVAAVDANFCEVSTLLAALDEPEKPEAEAEDVESFDDLLADVDSDTDEEVSGAGHGDFDPDTDEYESFDGFLDDDDDGDGEGMAATGEAAVDEASPIVLDDPAGVAEPLPEPELVAETVEEPKAPRPRKRKKISFV